MSEKKNDGRTSLFTCWSIGKVLEFLDLESLHCHGLALVPGPVDDGATPTLTQDAALILAVLQLAVLQEEPAKNAARGSDRTSLTVLLPTPLERPAEVEGTVPGQMGVRTPMVLSPHCRESRFKAACGVRWIRDKPCLVQFLTYSGQVVQPPQTFSVNWAHNRN